MPEKGALGDRTLSEVFSIGTRTLMATGLQSPAPYGFAQSPAPIEKTSDKVRCHGSFCECEEKRRTMCPISTISAQEFAANDSLWSCASSIAHFQKLQFDNDDPHGCLAWAMIENKARVQL